MKTDTPPVRPSTSATRVFKAFEIKTGASHRPHKESDSPYGFRKWQAEAFATLVDARYRRLLAPTGSGKSLTMKGLACTDMAAGARVVLAYPMTDIEPGFAAPMDIRIKGKVHRWEPVVASEATCKADLVVAFLTDPSSRGSALICTHSTLRNAHKRIQELLSTGELRANPWRNCSVFLDEGHHSEFDEGEETNQAIRNRLHSFLEFYLSRSNGKLLTTTATWVRSTRSKILSPEIAARFTTYQLTLPRYLDEVAGIESLSFRFVIGDPSTCLKTIVSEAPDRKTLTFLQVTGSRRVKEEQLVQIQTTLKPLRLHVVDLVTDDSLRPFRQKHLVNAINRDDGSSPDMVLALNKCTEGFDWPELSRIILMHPRRSLPATTQIFGRELRHYPGKRRVELNIILPAVGDKLEADILKAHLKTLLATMLLGWQCKAVPLSSYGRKRSPTGRGKHDRSIVAMETIAQLIERYPSKMVELSGSDASETQVDRFLNDVSTEVPALRDAAVRELVKLKMIGQPSQRSLPDLGRGADEIDFDLSLSQTTLRRGIRAYCALLGIRDLRELVKRLGSAVLPDIEFSKAREIARGYNFEVKDDYYRAWRAGTLPKGMPGDPRNAYMRHPDWEGMPDFLGARTSRNNLPFEQARSLARTLNLPTLAAYKAAHVNGDIPEGLPRSLHVVYGQHAKWRGIPDFLGNHKQDWLPFNEARTAARGLQCKSGEAYMKVWRERGSRTEGLPLKLVAVYGAHPRWKGLWDFLGIKQPSSFADFTQARRYVRALRLNSKDEFTERAAAGLLPEWVPKSPAGVYKRTGDWTNWTDFLGTSRTARGEFLDFEEARRLMHRIAPRMQIETQETYSKKWRSGKLPKGLPGDPYDKYGEHPSWKGWSDFLGHTKYRRGYVMNFTAARNIARSLELESKGAYKAAFKAGELPDGMPGDPYSSYSSDPGWKGTYDFLGAPKPQKHLTFAQAKKLVKHLPSQSAYHEFRKEHPELPADPSRTYRSKWLGWCEFLSKPEINRVLPFEQARTLARSLKLKDSTVYHSEYLAGRLPPGLPASPSRAYGKHVAWRGIPDFLGNGNTRNGRPPRKR